MKALTVYECEYCKKLFRTPNRHDCKMRPELKNCWTCKQFKCFEHRQDGPENSYMVALIEKTIDRVKVNKEECTVVGCSYPEIIDCPFWNDGWGMDTLQSRKYNLGCEGWEAKKVGNLQTTEQKGDKAPKSKAAQAAMTKGVSGDGEVQSNTMRKYSGSNGWVYHPSGVGRNTDAHIRYG